jgi:hypothetical protein
MSGKGLLEANKLFGEFAGGLSGKTSWVAATKKDGSVELQTRKSLKVRMAQIIQEGRRWIFASNAAGRMITHI